MFTAISPSANIKQLRVEQFVHRQTNKSLAFLLREEKSLFICPRDLCIFFFILHQFRFHFVVVVMIFIRLLSATCGGIKSIAQSIDDSSINLHASGDFSSVHDISN